tara:strand:- start:37 stop:273 length:237 start_codon:yes stop_codon:yes gene_type:complete
MSHSLNWLIRHHASGAQRLPRFAERMVLFAAAAELDENLQAKGGGSARVNDTAMHVSQRAIALNRTKAHFKSDNRTAV